MISYRLYEKEVDIFKSEDDKLFKEDIVKPP